MSCPLGCFVYASLQIVAERSCAYYPFVGPGIGIGYKNIIKKIRNGQKCPGERWRSEKNKDVTESCLKLAVEKLKTFVFSPPFFAFHFLKRHANGNSQKTMESPARGRGGGVGSAWGCNNLGMTFVASS